MSRRPRLQRPQYGSWLAGPFGRLVARPWFDPVALWVATRQMLPTSRLWASAIASDGDLDRFIAGIGRAPHRMPSRPSLARAVRRVAADHRAWLDADGPWIEAFFGPADVDERRLIDLERRWRRTSHARFGARRHLAPFGWSIRPPCVRYAIPSPDIVAARFDPASPPALRPPDILPPIEASRTILTNFGIEYWLRAPSPLAGDTLWAHVYEPEGVANPPTAILCHGLGMEFEMLSGVADSTLGLLHQGIRVVQPSAPGHNRRCRPGWFGGEETLATQPLGAIEALRAATVELAMLVRWARARSDGAAVALGGTSLGALTTQFAADRTRDWPAEFRCDALLLATTSAMAGMLSTVSSLARNIGLPEALAAAGWDRESLARLAPLTDPAAPAPIDPHDIVLLVASRDTVTPAEDGMILARRWSVPADNVFVRERGHFSAAIGTLFDRAPYDALAARLNRRRGAL